MEWARQFVQEIRVDNRCAMHLWVQETGSFKRAKHNKVRFFWVKDLIDDGVATLKYTPSEELVANMLTKANMCQLRGAKRRFAAAAQPPACRSLLSASQSRDATILR